MKHFLLLAAFLWSGLVVAHEVRPSYLELHETTSGEFNVLWKTPMQDEARLALEPVFSGEVASVAPKVSRRVPGAAIQTWVVRSPLLRGQSVRIDGLEGTMTDALVRIDFADGSAWTQRLTPARPAALIPVKDAPFAVASTYLKLGIEHILTGVDHLLFVLGLLILARERWRLLVTVTAFTLAHSITLALAALGAVHVPQQPVEAVIALSIAFVAVEIVRSRQGKAGLAARSPWIVAFAFGLLHGFGFAGALSEVGLPPGHIPLALLFFNLGVEAGQLLFIAAVLGSAWLIHRVRAQPPRWLKLAPPYCIGSIAMFWVFQRVGSF
ncbi:MAG TPA: HupE/UreJ family protein [Burkholderiales bacterium]|nr:HupE/UreJ family protein [Burkholderiales bacterium]